MFIYKIYFYHKMEDKPKLELIVNNDTRLSPVSTDKITESTIKKVLNYLKSNDEYYDYNVPIEIINSDPKEIHKHIINIYSKPEFIITGRENIRTYSKLYDLVEFNPNQDQFSYKTYLKPGHKGIIKSVDHSHDFPLNILWDNQGISKKFRLNHNGDKLTLKTKKFLKTKTYYDKDDIIHNAKKGDIVISRYEKIEYEFYVPSGIKGIITEINDNEKFPVKILFKNTKNYIPSHDGIILGDYKNLSLIIDNPFDISKIYNNNK